MRIFKHIGLLVFLCLLGACDTTGSLVTLRKAPLTDSGYKHLLGKLYLGFAEAELKEYDWWSSKYFADKGLRVAYDQDVEPENPEDWSIEAEHLPELTSAREDLIYKLTPTYIRSHPREAAIMTFTFDCWVEQQNEGWEEKEIAACRDRFYRVLRSGEPSASVPLSHVPIEVGVPIAPAAPKPIAKKPRVKIAPKATIQKKQRAMGGPISSAYLLYFPWGKGEIDGLALDELDEIAAYFKGRADYELIINGHADRSGSDDYNLKLSEKRAAFIRSYLMQQGIPEKHIQYFAFGESDPKISTDDGERRKENRRVEITIE